MVSESGLRDPDLLDLGLYEIPFPYLWCWKHLSALRLMRKRAEGPGMQQARPRNQRSRLAPLLCLFALTYGSLGGYWTCSLKGTFVLQGSAENMYHRGRRCREPEQAICCWFLNQPPPSFTPFNQGYNNHHVCFTVLHVINHLRMGDLLQPKCIPQVNSVPNQTVPL